MKKYISICFVVIAGVAATVVIAQTKTSKEADTPAVQQISDADNIMRIVTETQNALRRPVKK